MKCIVMPKAGVSVETCIMGVWAKNVGEQVSKGELLFEYETDKSSFEYRAEDDGVLLKLLVQEGDDVPVLQPVCYIGSLDEIVPEKPAAVADEKTDKSVPMEKSEPVSAAAPAVPAVSAACTAGEMLFISPRAKKTAAQMDIHSLDGIVSSGPNGRIIERDVVAYAKSAIPTPVAVVQKAEEVSAQETVSAVEYEDKKLSNIRKVIAKNMQSSLSTMAQLTHTSSFDATQALNYRKTLKASQETLNLPNITFNDIVMYAVSRVLLHHPELNAHFFDDHMRYFTHVHLGMAVDTPRGLLVPTIFNADTKSLAEISREAKELSAACRDGSISPDKLTGASFTVSNLGSFGVESFTPVINPPQTGILGVDCTVDRVRMVDGQITVYPAAGLSLTYDHRALDGAPASRFLQELCRTLENFTALLAC